MRKSPEISSFEPQTAADLLAQYESLALAVVHLRCHGSTGTEIARAQGAVDGFGRALLTAGLASERDLLLAAQSARRGGSGPATRVLVAADGAELTLRRVG